MFSSVVLLVSSMNVLVKMSAEMGSLPSSALKLVIELEFSAP
jgi:hypothetical protein